MRHQTLIVIAALALASCACAVRAQQPDATAKPAILTNIPTDSAVPQTASPSDLATPPPPLPATITPAAKPALPTPALEPSVDNPAAQASDPDFRAALSAAVPVEPAAYAAEPYHLRLHNLHTLEDIDIVYRIGDNYQPEAIARLNYFLRDHNTNDVIAYDPREFDLLHEILIRLRRPGATIDVVCGYRTQETNEILRASSQGVAEHSQHILGHAIDIRIPGSTTTRLRNAALSLNEGGSATTRPRISCMSMWVPSALGPTRRRRHRRGHLRRVGTHHRQIAQRRHHSIRTDGM